MQPSSAVPDQVKAQALQDERARLGRFRKAWQFYGGDAPRALATEDGAFDDNVPLNFSQIIVDKGADFLFGTAPTFQVTDENDETDDDAQTDLDEAWRLNRRDSTLLKLGINGGVTGCAAVKLMPEFYDTDDGAYPRVALIDPSNLLIEWDAEDYEAVYRYTIQWSGVDPKDGKAFARRQKIEPTSGNARKTPSWTIRDEVSKDQQANWTTLSTSTWRYPWAPIFTAQNLPMPNEWWGLADLEDHVLRLVAKLEFLASNITRIIRHHAHPTTWGKGLSGKTDIDRTVNRLLKLPTGAEIGNLEMTSDLASSITQYRTLKEALHEITRVPEIATGRTENVGQLSGLALSILYGPLIDKTETKQSTYGPMLDDLNARMLELLGYDDAGLTAATVWPELLPSDPKAESETLTLHKELGIVSEQTIAEKLGYDYEAEQSKIKEEGGGDAAGTEALRNFDAGTGPGAEDGAGAAIQPEPEVIPPGASGGTA